MTRASIYLMNLDKITYHDQVPLMSSHINIGIGKDLIIKELAENIKETVGFKGEIYFDQSKPSGTQRKFLDSSRINNLGFKPEISLKEGLTKNYQDYIKNNANF